MIQDGTARSYERGAQRLSLHHVAESERISTWTVENPR
jgi:hypothetical protein